MPKEKTSHTNSNSIDFDPGTVLYLYCDDLKKNKYFLVLSFATSAAPVLFIINTELNEFKLKRPWLKMSQFKINKSDYNFLRHNSYINCSEIKWWFNKKKIRTQINDDEERNKGQLMPVHIKLILKIVHNSPTLSNVEKEIIDNSLSKVIK